MVWDQFSNNDQQRDPWGSHGNRNKGHEQGPPDLGAILARLTKGFKGFRGVPSGHCPFGGNTVESFRWLSVVLGVLLLVWGLSGFYTIKEAERGVVTRFGRFNQVVQPGLNWKPTFIDVVKPINIERVRELPAAGAMLTKDENVVSVDMNVQYRVVNPAKYLFSVVNADDSLRQATDSALRYVVGHTTMDEVLTRGRAKVRQDTWQLIEGIIAAYDMGLQILDVNFQSARPPEAVKASFDDAIAAQEDQQRYMREAEAYARAEEPKARGNARRMEEEAEAYKARVILEAKGEVAHFSQLLPQYLHAPKITSDRLYIETMERLLRQTRKVVVDSAKGNNVMVLPLEQALKGMRSSSERIPSHQTLPAPEPSESLAPLPEINPSVTNGSSRRGGF